MDKDYFFAQKQLNSCLSDWKPNEKYNSKRSNFGEQVYFSGFKTT